MSCQLIARGADLIGVRRCENRRGDVLGAVVLETIEAHIGPCLQHLGINLVGQIFDVEYALVVDGHYRSDFQFG